MRLITVVLMLLFTLTFQELPDAAVLKKQVQEASKQRQSIQYVREHSICEGAFG